jgi:hypothetical protein
MRRARLTLIGLIVGYLVAIEPAYACTCMAPATAAEALQKSSAVFRGRVITIYRSFLDRVGITNTAGYRVQFEITKQLKGTP